MSKYNRTYHLPWSPGSTNDDRISNGVESLLGIDIVITEKLDGENCGMTKLKKHQKLKINLVIQAKI